ncbi:MAG: hypothetical protein IPG01_15565 [Chitinophagaceae bacterium]|nr:hypothetical protein [Chitinophagaceae bacterium]
MKKIIRIFIGGACNGYSLKTYSGASSSSKDLFFRKRNVSNILPDPAGFSTTFISAKISLHS